MKRQFAIPKSLGLADRIANASHANLNGSQWPSAERGVALNILWNMRRQFGRQCSGWSKRVVRVRFAGRC
jgi:hypothetical protein